MRCIIFSTKRSAVNNWFVGPETVKATSPFFIFFFYLFLFNSCKKAVHADQVYTGNWISTGYYTSFITITPGGFGTYYTIGYNGVDNRKDPYKGMTRIDWSGNHLYMGITKFKIIEHPHVYKSAPDSIMALGTFHKTCGIKMT